MARASYQLGKADGRGTGSAGCEILEEGLLLLIRPGLFLVPESLINIF